ncbi:MAG TPA: DUF4926 domain-containing protein [Candidatus Deferrimicrobium sp.]|nr:DUF4926 domain-containing protein [Candidatus Kapabacteria bacterium]HLP58249.1 DUF4926 domain-containing protein [Candidatus Deferrimicrobium sp.]
MIHELDTVALNHDIIDYGLKEGDLGAVVHCYEDGEAFEVEFVDFDGKTIALLTLNKEEIRQLSGRQVLHVRELLPHRGINMLNSSFGAWKNTDHLELKNGVDHYIRNLRKARTF